MGSLFKTPKAPAPMNVGAVAADANRQNTANATQQAAFNRLDQTDALGNTLDYKQTGTDANGNPSYSIQQGLGGYGQQAAEGQSGLAAQYYGTAGRGAPDSSAAFNQAYGLATANLEPRFQRAQDASINRLRNQGLDPTSDAYKSQMNDLALQQNEARNNLVSGLQSQMHQQGLANRQQQMTELAPGVQFGNRALGSSYVGAPAVNVNNVDVTGLHRQNQQDQWTGYNAEMQQRNAMLGGLGAIGGSLLMAPMTGGTSLGGMLGNQMLGGLGGKSAPIGPWQTYTERA